MSWINTRKTTLLMAVPLVLSLIIVVLLGLMLVSRPQPE